MVTDKELEELVKRLIRKYKNEGFQGSGLRGEVYREVRQIHPDAKATKVWEVIKKCEDAEVAQNVKGSFQQTGGAANEPKPFSGVSITSFFSKYKGWLVLLIGLIISLYSFYLLSKSIPFVQVPKWSEPLITYLFPASLFGVFMWLSHVAPPWVLKPYFLILVSAGIFMTLETPVFASTIAQIKDLVSESEELCRVKVIVKALIRGEVVDIDFSECEKRKANTVKMGNWNALTLKWGKWFEDSYIFQKPVCGKSYNLYFTLSNKNTPSSDFDISVKRITAYMLPKKYGWSEDELSEAISSSEDTKGIILKPGYVSIRKVEFDRVPMNLTYIYFLVRIESEQSAGGTGRFGIVKSKEGHEDFIYKNEEIQKVEVNPGPVDVYPHIYVEGSPTPVIIMDEDREFDIIINIINKGERGIANIPKVILVQTSEKLSPDNLEITCPGGRKIDCSDVIGVPGTKGNCIEIDLDLTLYSKDYITSTFYSETPMIESYEISCTGRVKGNPDEFLKDGKMTDFISVIMPSYEYTQEFVTSATRIVCRKVTTTTVVTTTSQKIPESNTCDNMCKGMGYPSGRCSCSPSGVYTVGIGSGTEFGCADYGCHPYDAPQTCYCEKVESEGALAIYEEYRDEIAYAVSVEGLADELGQDSALALIPSIIEMESRGDANAASGDSYGLMQINIKYAPEECSGILDPSKDTKDELLDPEKNIQCGTRIFMNKLRYMKNYNEYDLENLIKLSLAAYNAGQTPIANATEDVGDSKWDKISNVDVLKKACEDYYPDPAWKAKVIIKYVEDTFSMYKEMLNYIGRR